MSEVVTKKKEPGMAQLVITLFAISAICAVLLGLVNMITMDPIKAAIQAKTDKAMQAVLAADSYTEVPYSGGNAMVTKIYQAGDQGWVVQVAPSGFGGAIDMVVGVDTSFTITGVDIIKMTETSGLGANASKPEFKEQFKGASGSVAVTKDGGAINALTGATITSRAVADGVNAALEAAKSLG